MKDFPDYQVEVDQTTREEWTNLMQFFDDATIMQTWDFVEAICPKQQVSRLILRRREGAVVGLAQVRIVSLPFLKRGIAHVEWGPMWRRRWELPDLQVFAALLTALREEYAARRKLLLRIKPKITGDACVELKHVLVKTGFKMVFNNKEERTIIKDITAPLPDIRKSLNGNWRKYLSRAERNSLEIHQGTSALYYKDFLSLYRSLLARKGIKPYIDVDRWIRLQKIISEEEKPQIFIAYHEGIAVSGIIASCLGNTGYPIIAASNNAGLKLFASYLMHWRVIEWLKENGCCYYDLAGIDPEKNPGTYHFKKGFKGNEVSFIGQFVHCSDPLSRMVVWVGKPLRDLALTFSVKKNNGLCTRQFESNQ